MDGIEASIGCYKIFVYKMTICFKKLYMNTFKNKFL